MKRVVIFSGAGVSAESGVSTFRDSDDGLWYNYKVDEVATKEGWKHDKEKVLEFHNMLRGKLSEVEPNQAHKDIADLEKYFDVTVVTQNVDDLHERGGSKNIIHIHGELTKARSTYYHPMSVDDAPLYDVGHGEINIGDKCDEHGSQLRPHTVLFGEYPCRVDEAYEAFMLADYVIIVGTGFPILYTIDMVRGTKPGCKKFYVDPDPQEGVVSCDYIKEPATTGVKKAIDEIFSLESLVV